MRRTRDGANAKRGGRPRCAGQGLEPPQRERLPDGIREIVAEDGQVIVLHQRGTLEDRERERGIAPQQIAARAQRLEREQLADLRRRQERQVEGVDDHLAEFLGEAEQEEACPVAHQGRLAPVTHEVADACLILLRREGQDRLAAKFLLHRGDRPRGLLRPDPFRKSEPRMVVAGGRCSVPSRDNCLQARDHRLE